MNNHLSTQKYNDSFFILKFLCACMVVFLHVPGIYYEHYLILPILRIAVPCFYMISGFYLVDCKNKITYQRIKKQAKKTVKYLIIFNYI